MLLRFLKDMLILGGVLFWFCIFLFLAIFISVTILEKRQERGSESDG